MKNIVQKIAIWLVFIAFIAFVTRNSLFPQARTHRVDRTDACFMSQKFVSEELKAPSSARFPDWTEQNCQATSNGDLWTVVSFVDAQNGFGATVRSDYVVKMRYNNVADSWTLTNLSITP